MLLKIEFDPWSRARGAILEEIRQVLERAGAEPTINAEASTIRIKAGRISEDCCCAAEGILKNHPKDVQGFAWNGLEI